MLTVCRELLHHLQPGSGGGGPVLRKDEFKIVYVAPMKALGEESWGSAPSHAVLEAGDLTPLVDSLFIVFPSR